MRFSASRAALLQKCRYAFREVGTMSKWPDSEEARFGRALHRCAEWWIGGQPPDVVMAAREFDCEDEVPEMLRVWHHMLAWLEANVSSYPASAELKIVVDLEQRTARRITEGGVRDYGTITSPFQFGMTLDIYQPLSAKGGPAVWDWKTGHTAEGYWPQIGLNALGVAWLYGLDEVQGGILHATPDGVDDSRVRRFDRLDLAAIADDFYRLLAEVPEAAPNPGDHCTDMRCGEFHACPETAKVIDKMNELVPSNENGSRKLSLDIQDADHAVYVLHRLRAFFAFAEQIKATVDRFVGDKVLPVEGGGFLKKTYRTVTRTNVVALMALARAKGATDEEIESCTQKHRESAGIRVVKG